jgi:G3E family GTPase
VVATVDTVNGLATLERYPQSVKQVALADRLILTKTDLAQGQCTELAARLAALNPTAKRAQAAFGEVDPARLFDTGHPASGRARDLSAWLGLDGHSDAPAAGHHAGISCCAILRNEPIKAIALTLFLEALAEHCGADLLRLKGIVNIAENPDRPAVIHGVQHVFHPPVWLDRWPSRDRRSRLICIGRDIQQAWIEALIRAIEAEVAEVAAVGA